MLLLCHPMGRSLATSHSRTSVLCHSALCSTAQPSKTSTNVTGVLAQRVAYRHQQYIPWLIQAGEHKQCH